MKIKSVFILMLVFLFSCTTTKIVSKQQSNLTPAMVKKFIKKGKTLQSEILEKFGAPNIISTNRYNKEVWSYHKMSFDSSAQNNGAGVNLLVFGAGKSKISGSSTTSSFDLIITFKKNTEIVESYKMIASSF